MKKLTVILLMATFAISFVGCGEGTKDTGGNTQQQMNSAQDGLTENETLIDDGGIFWNTETSMYEIEEEILNGSEILKAWVDNNGLADALEKGFKEKYPTINLEVSIVGTGDAADKMALEGEAGTGADAFMLVHDHVSKATNSSILGIFGRYEDEIREKYLESAVGTVDIDGELYGVPVLIESIALFYNQTLLDQLANEDLIESATVPTDFEEIKEIARVYNDEKSNRWTMRWETGNAYMNHFVLTAFGYEMFGADGTDPDQLNLDTPEAIEGLKYLHSMRDMFDVPSADTNWDTTVMEFAKGETPFMLVGPWAIEDVTTGAKENGFEFGVVPLPMVDGKQPYTFSGVQLSCASAYSKYPGAARALAMYIAGEEMGEYLYGSLNKVLALKEDYVKDIPGLLEDDKVQGVMKQAEFAKPMPAINEVEYYWEVAGTTFQSVWDGLMTPDDAVKKAEEDYNMLRQTAQ